MKRPIPYDELERHFQVPKSWMPGEQSYFSRFRRLPRRLKKKAKKVPYSFLDLRSKLWYHQGLVNPDLNRFLIKKVVEAEQRRIS